RGQLGADAGTAGRRRVVAGRRLLVAVADRLQVRAGAARGRAAEQGQDGDVAVAVAARSAHVGQREPAELGVALRLTAAAVAVLGLRAPLDHAEGTSGPGKTLNPPRVPMNGSTSGSGSPTSPPACTPAGPLRASPDDA